MIFKLIIFALFIFVLLPVFRLGVSLFRAYRHVKRRAEAFAGTGRARPGEQETTQSYGKRRRARHSARKVFHPEDGEYVRFEEIEVDIVQEQERRRRYGDTAFRMEEQVSDAEWTDLRL
ncbi:DUF4834 family protein [uncultured Muribaculum sp.]|uniref:DUF4834 family protein n=1 Tax=uncultured Muribaculum sp. TaxID=1918613 RepID=UPI0025D22A99|nr:DUF4834 family protein [uncultured Muribaculum sp.]